jgi:hypothetical protein
VLHGIGPSWWNGRENPMPTELGIEDVLVPSQTFLSFRNLEFFAVYRQWTYAELWDMTHRKDVDKGWNLPLVETLLKSLADQSLQSTIMGQRWLMPEKLSEDLKENAGLFMTSAAPTLFIWDFYYRRYDEDADNEQWDRRIVLDYMQMQPEAMRSAISEDAKTQFLYQKDDYAGPLSEIIHFQVGNCSNVAPFRYYSVRSLGFLLFAVCQIQNRLYNRFCDSTFYNLLELFRNVGEDDREKLEKVDLWHMGIVPDGLSFVTAAERHEVNEQQVQMMFSMNKQLMAESSSTWMPEVDTGTAKEQTLGEAQIRLQTSASLSNAIMSQHYERAVFLYRESCRRFCLKGTRNRLAKDFQERVLRQGVPMEMLDVEAWDVVPDRVLGGGNKAMEGLQADKLMAARGAYDADAQRMILKIYTLANTDNAQLTQELVPLKVQPISQATQLGTLAFGTLMEGLPVQQQRGFSEIEYVKTILSLSGIVLQQIEGLEQTPGTLETRMAKCGGMHNALEHAKEHLAPMMGDAGNGELLKMLQAEFARQENELAKLTQHVDEELKAAQENQADGEQAKAQVKLQAEMLMAQVRAKNKDADAEQKRQHKDAQWSGENERRNATTTAEIQRTNAKSLANLQAQMAKVEADIAALDAKTAAEIRRPKPEANGNE